MYQYKSKEIITTVTFMDAQITVYYVTHLNGNETWEYGIDMWTDEHFILIPLSDDGCCNEAGAVATACEVVAQKILGHQ